ncbi:parathyroid hormone/parathyroid hormone-related peptide receptor-like [Centruroides sculpturatus]|uniref:parathyroid hormone/parathyroid hormone-related peptide receptor-like n=1 Tax=Centruroides sculpturatus TaxID=218467 RepID=UPI000C6E08A4|nr:parathyroid hormone/parathyroid hormone-related peptide receptor-like [Centruroides sculpturatus]
MFFFRKLRCPRNSLHMHLFLSFIMRALMFFLKDSLFIEGVGFSSNIGYSEDNFSLFRHEKNNIDCKVFTSFWQYFLMANYCWILIEGLYLHNLIFLSMFTDTSGIRYYVILGWGLPVIVIIPWIIVRATLENTLMINKYSENIFYLKQMLDDKKWFKSTLILVPLFGVHYALLLAVSLAASVNEIVELVWLYIDQLFSAFQGSFVALLYCFLNGEVQAEIKKLLQTEPTHSKCFSHASILTQSLTYLSRGRNSIQSLHSATEKKDGYQSTSPLPYIPRQDDHDITSMSMTPNITCPLSHSTTDVVITFKENSIFNHGNIKISSSDHQLSETKESLL